MRDRSHPLELLRQAAARRDQAGVRRRLVPRGADHDGLLDLASNDYLGLGGDQRLAAGAARAAQEWGTGATGSRLVTGTTALHTSLEARLAEFAGAQAALVFSSGYLANLIVLSALAAALGGPDGVLIVSEAGNHASLIDGCRLARARVTVTPHRDPDAVRKVLADRDEPAAARALAAVRERGELWAGFRLSFACRTVAHTGPRETYRPWDYAIAAAPRHSPFMLSTI